MIRVPGTVPLWVDIDRDRGDIIVSTSGSSTRISAVQSAALRVLLERAEWELASGLGNMDKREGDLT